MSRKYIKLVNNFAVEPGGYFFLGTFSEKGPLKCHGLEIKQYSEGSMVGTFIDHFMVVKCFTERSLLPRLTQFKISSIAASKK